MTHEPAVRLVEDHQRLAVEVRRDHNRWATAGPTLPLGYLGDDGVRLARDLFDAAPDNLLAAESLVELVARMEQVTVDRLYACPPTQRTAARAHVVLTWAVLVVQALGDLVEPVA